MEFYKFDFIFQCLKHIIGQLFAVKGDKILFEQKRTSFPKNTYDFPL